MNYPGRKLRSTFHQIIEFVSKKALFFILSIVLFSCKENDDIPVQRTNLQSGVVISFDDDFVDEWFEVNTILQSYNWKATFFVSKFDQLSVAKIQKLKNLKSYGHEIGAHGINHLNVPTFIAANGTSDYLDQEIYPLLHLMNSNDLAPTSFSYPYGSRNASTDNLLLKKFQIIRGTTYSNANPDLQNCYYANNRLVVGLGIDKNYSHATIQYFLSLLEFAKKNNKIVIFYAHKPVLNFQNKYETEYRILRDICSYVKNNNMKFYKMSELYNLSNLNQSKIVRSKR